MTEEAIVSAADPEAVLNAQKRRNAWLAVALVVFVIVVGVTTAVRIQEADFSGGDRLYFSGYLDEAAAEKADREAQARIQARQAAEAQAAQSTETPDE